MGLLQSLELNRHLLILLSVAALFRLQACEIIMLFRQVFLKLSYLLAIVSNFFFMLLHSRFNLLLMLLLNSREYLLIVTNALQVSKDLNIFLLALLFKLLDIRLQGGLLCSPRIFLLLNIGELLLSLGQRLLQLWDIGCLGLLGVQLFLKVT